MRTGKRHQARPKKAPRPVTGPYTLTRPLRTRSKAGID